MATTTLDNVAAILKEVYENKIVDQLRSEAIGHKRIKSTSEGVTSRAGGKYVDFGILVGRNQGISFRGEREQLGRPGRNRYSEVHVPLKYGYARGSITGPTMRLAEENYQAFASALDEDQQGMKDQVAREESRMFYGDGTGLLTLISADAGGADLSFTVDDPYWLEDTMDIDILNASNGSSLTNATDRTIATVDPDTGAVTVEAGSSGTFAATPNTHGVFRQGNYNREPQGLRSIVKNSGTLYGVDPSSVPLWKSKQTAVNGPLSEAHMIKMCDDISTNGGKVSAIFTTLGVRRSWFNLLSMQRRFNGSKEFEGGLVGLVFNYGAREVPVVADPDLRETGAMYFLDESTFKFYQTHDWQYMDKDGSMFKWVQDFDEYQYLMNKYYELGCKRRNANGKLTGVEES